MAKSLRYRKSIRLKEYDYSQPGEYFVTVCSFDHNHIFGEIVEEEMILSQEGMIAQRCWKEIPDHFANVELDEFIVMPNHIHEILVLNENTVGTRQAVSLHEQFGKPTRGTIPTIIRSYKSAVTKAINEINGTPGKLVWQSRFYDRVIRNEKELDNIRKYIAANILQWAAGHADESPENVSGTPLKNLGANYDCWKD